MAMLYKQVILVRQDLKLAKGKLAAQCAHASVECVLKTNRKLLESWRKDSGKKVVLRVENEKELLKFKTLADDAQLKNALITDAGRTAVSPGTVTCLGIGPDEEKKIDSLTHKLRMV